jgi:WD40 repeat protein
VAPPLVHDREITGLHFSADGRTLVTAAGEPGGQGTARIWDTRTGQALTDPMLHTDGVSSMGTDADGQRLATGSFDGTIRVWDYRTAKPRFAPIRFEDAVVRLQFRSDMEQLIAASGNTITLIDLIDSRKPAPGWFVTLAERVGGLHLGEDGVLQPISDRSTTGVRDALASQIAHDDYERFGHWFFSLPQNNRTTTPSRASTSTH